MDNSQSRAAQVITLPEAAEALLAGVELPGDTRVKLEPLTEEQMVSVRQLFGVQTPRRWTMEEIRALVSSMTMEQLESFMGLAVDELFDRRRDAGLT